MIKFRCSPVRILKKSSAMDAEAECHNFPGAWKRVHDHTGSNQRELTWHSAHWAGMGDEP